MSGDTLQEKKNSLKGTVAQENFSNGYKEYVMIFLQFLALIFGWNTYISAPFEQATKFCKIFRSPKDNRLQSSKLLRCVWWLFTMWTPYGCSQRQHTSMYNCTYSDRKYLREINNFVKLFWLFQIFLPNKNLSKISLQGYFKNW